MIFLTGDTHGDFRRLTTNSWPEGATLSKQDYLIFLGDWGFLWDNSKQEEYARNWIGSRPWTSIVLWGNHENYSMIKKLGKEVMFGAPVDLIRTSGGYIYGLKNGYIYKINGHTFFVMGGGMSIDKQYRIEGKSWWAEELPSRLDWDRAWDTLTAANWKVDYILTHAPPMWAISDILGTNAKVLDPVSMQLEDIFIQFKNRGMPFKAWYFGHLHQDKRLQYSHSGERKFFSTYEGIYQLHTPEIHGSS